MDTEGLAEPTTVSRRHYRWLWAAMAALATLGVSWLTPSRTIAGHEASSSSLLASGLHRRLDNKVKVKEERSSETSSRSKQRKLNTAVSEFLPNLLVNLRGLDTQLSQDAISTFMVTTEQAFGMYYSSRRRLRDRHLVQNERALLAKDEISHYTTQLVFDDQKANAQRVRIFYNQTVSYTLNDAGSTIQPDDVVWEPMILQSNRQQFIAFLKSQNAEFEGLTEIDSPFFDSVNDVDGDDDDDDDDDDDAPQLVDVTLESLYVNLHNVSYELSQSAMDVFAVFVVQAYGMYYQQRRRLMERGLLAQDEVANYTTSVTVLKQEPHGDNQVRVYYDQNLTYTLPADSDLTPQDVAWEPMARESTRNAFVDHLSQQHPEFSNLTEIDSPFFETVDDVDPNEVPDEVKNNTRSDNNFGEVKESSGGDDFDKKGILYIVIAALLTVGVFGMGWWNMRRLQALDRIEDARLVETNALGLDEEDDDDDVESIHKAVVPEEEDKEEEQQLEDGSLPSMS